MILNLEKVNLIIKNMELLIESLKEEIAPQKSQSVHTYSIDDYDEVFNEYED